MLRKTCVYDGYSFVILWPKVTRHSHIPQASEWCFCKTSHQLFLLNNHYENKWAPFNKSYICFFINPSIPLMSLFCTIESIFPLWNWLNRWHSIRHMFDFSLIQQFSCWVDQYEVNHLWKSSLFDGSSSFFVFVFCSQRPPIQNANLSFWCLKVKKGIVCILQFSREVA